MLLNRIKNAVNSKNKSSDTSQTEQKLKIGSNEQESKQPHRIANYLKDYIKPEINSQLEIEANKVKSNTVFITFYDHSIPTTVTPGVMEFKRTDKVSDFSVAISVRSDTLKNDFLASIKVNDTLDVVKFIPFNEDMLNEKGRKFFGDILETNKVEDGVGRENRLNTRTVNNKLGYSDEKVERSISSLHNIEDSPRVREAGNNTIGRNDRTTPLTETTRTNPVTARDSRLNTGQGRLRVKTVITSLEGLPRGIEEALQEIESQGCKYEDIKITSETTAMIIYRESKFRPEN